MSEEKQQTTEEKFKAEAARILDELSKPFIRTISGRNYPDHKWLPKDGKSMANKIICMPFVSGGQVRDRLNEVLGTDGWMFKSRLETDGTRTGTLSISILGTWVDRDGVGTKSKQEGEKGADTDSLKRAARNFGVGAYLESLGRKYVDAVGGKPVDKQGKPLYGDNLNKYLNGYSNEQGLLAEVLIINPGAWQMQEFKDLWNKFNI